MSTKYKNKKIVHVVDGEAIDQEAVIRLRPQIEDYVRQSGKKFRKTNVTWDMNEKGNFNFKVFFYA